MDQVTRYWFAAQRLIQTNGFNSARIAIDNRPEAPLGLIAVHDLEKLLLLSHRAKL